MQEKRDEIINNFKEIETKWQKLWDENKAFEANPNEKKKFFITFPFPYMNGLPHLGGAFTILRVDIMARYKRMRGYNVLFPQGWHATGGPIVASAKRIKEKDPKKIKELKEMGVSDDIVSNFEDPTYWVFHFTSEWEKDLRRYGLSIDWRRKFYTTSLNPYFSKFVEWQYYKLRDLNYIAKGSHPVVWCPKEKKVVGDHDRPDEYAGIGPVDATIIKFKIENDDLIIPTLTYRPETIFGVTNIWINKDSTYNIAEIDGEKWIINDYMIDELSDQKHEVKVLKKIQAKEIIGKYALNPINNKKIPILPASFVIYDEGTGIVMSVPAHAPYDYIALEDLKRNKEIIKEFGLNEEEIKKLNPLVIIKSSDFKDIPAKEMVRKLNIKSQNDVELLEKATKELYAKEFYSGIMYNVGEYSNIKVNEAREKIIENLKDKNKALKVYTLPSKVYCRCGARTHVKFVENQWFLLYSNESWKNKSRELVKNMNFYPESAREDFLRLIDWLSDWAFTHMNELGTPLPWDNTWVIESLSDSTIYMAYYTIAHYIQNKIEPSKLIPELFDYIFLGIGNLDELSQKTQLNKDLIEKMRQEFLYWYPVDLRISGKDLMQNHLLFFIYHHAAIFDKDKWPKGIGINGWVLLNGEKMSKNKGNFLLLRDALNKWGADVTRWSEVMAGADPGYDDANFETSIVDNAIDELNSWLELVKNNYNKGRDYKLSLDDWFESVINSTIKEVTEDMEQTRFKTALVKSYYYLKNKYKWYLTRANIPNKEVINDYLENVTLMIAPIVPHIAEEAWHIMGHKDLVSLHQWPLFDENKINKKFEKAEELIERIIKDTKELINLIGETNKVYIIIASPWKYELFDLAKEIAKNNKSITDLKQKLLENDFKIEKSKVVKVVNMISKYPELIENYIPRELEIKSIQESKEFLSKELKKEIVIEFEENSKLPRSDLALPGRPALYLEKQVSQQNR
ncbi:MAG: leucine--tRNA ligase [Caldisphaera sp.]|uniref:leucine--tRNA ligase n=1 Tax=Caldisphaera sp. TaxID=2060322 RepID=UPI000CC78964|nr:MAG: leucine--tRNA ligase [Caldisphaera sp.]